MQVTTITLDELDQAKEFGKIIRPTIDQNHNLNYQLHKNLQLNYRFTYVGLLLGTFIITAFSIFIYSKFEFISGMIINILMALAMLIMYFANDDNLKKQEEAKKPKIALINIFDNNFNQDDLSKLIKSINIKYQVNIVPKKLDYISIHNNNLYIYTKSNNQYKLIAIIDLDDPNFDKQKFWQTHTTPIKEYLNGNLLSNLKDV